ncbi:MAG TPA: glycosyl hydrolase [Thermoanaerobaculia bacterium]
MNRIAATLLALAIAASPLAAQKKSDEKREEKGGMKASTFSGLEFRSIGPALTSGRIGDIAVDPADDDTWFIAVASGNVWKTTNAGTTFTPIFDGEGSYSIGCVAIDPKNPLVVWVGTGENNSQRSVGYGDGVYKSVDGGKSWTNVGLKASEHIGKILIDPTDANVVWVAAQGPLWSAGGDRGLYKTTDGGKNWKKVLEISPNTGVSDIVMDPRDPNVVYASAYQRRRHVWTLIDGGPESGIHKTRDGGATWEKLSKGLPKEEMGRIGLAIAPARPDTVYAIIEAADKKGGFFRSVDGGANWEKRNDYLSSSPQYYQELIADPVDPDRVYAMDTFTNVTEDGGKTFTRLGFKYKHVDEHALWIDPKDTEHLLIGNDGGLYESWDRGANWDFKANLPVTQFYKIEADDSFPVYYVYGGTQDNFTLGGPSQTLDQHGGKNDEWFVATGGDGFQPRVDPKDPNIVYAESQHAGLVRFDRKSGEETDIRPWPAPGEAPLRFNWDSPLIISPHSPTRLYLGAQKLFRSDDRGNSWTAISGDLTRQIDRNKLKVMDRVWSANAVAKNASTSFYGNLVALSESPRQEGLIYTGSDDGLVQVTEDGGASWRKIEKFPGVPDMTYVTDLEASPHDANVVYAAFGNHKMGDFKPYLLRSGDKGRTWTSIAGDLPARGNVWTIVEDHVKPGLLFAGTEFGAYFSPDGGKKWIEFEGGLPTIAVRDIAIQEREDDLVLGTFGRGFYILDDYSPLRAVDAALLERDAVLFPLAKKVWSYVPSTPLGLKGKGFQGESYYVGENPPHGAVFTYYLKDELKSPRKQRREREAELVKENKEVYYPSWEDLRAEDRADDPAILLVVRDDEGNVVRRIEGPATAGFHRVAWDLRYPSSQPTELKKDDDDLFGSPATGPMVVPGRYTVTLAKRVDGAIAPLGDAAAFETAPLRLATLPAENEAEVLAFQKKTASLQRAALGALRLARDTKTRLDHLEQALLDTPGSDPALLGRVRALELRLRDIQEALTGDTVVSRYNEPDLPGIIDRIQQVVSGHWQTTGGPTATHRKGYEIAAQLFAPILADLTTLVETDLAARERDAEAAGAPWTPGRVPRWQGE